MQATETQEKKAPFTMPKKAEPPKFEDPLEYYEVTNVEFPNLPVQVCWDGGGPESKADKSHYIKDGRQKRWELATGKVHRIPRSLAEYLNRLSVPDPEAETDADGMVKTMNLGKVRKRYTCILMRDYVPPAETKA